MTGVAAFSAIVIFRKLLSYFQKSGALLPISFVFDDDF